MSKITLASFCLFLATTSSFATSSIGQTANGCNYSVINGKYLYDCSATNTSAPTTNGKPTEPLESYSAVPVVKSPNLSQPQNNNLVVPAAPAEKTIEARKPQPAALASSKPDDSEPRPYISQSYFGFLAGSTTLSVSGAGKSTGIGLTLGSNIDDYVGLELGYSYTTQDLNLDLESRESIPGSTIPANDSSLNAHLVTAEFQLHATDLTKSIRPYVAAGLGWKHSSLQDLGQAGFAGNTSIPGSSVAQNSFGTSTAIGAKFRFSETFQGVIDLRYFLPVIVGQAQVSQSSSDGSSGRLTSADSPLTKSGLYQLQLGVLYHF